MRTLKIKHFGEKVQGIRLDGDRRNPEPESVRVAFPGGDVDVVRTDDGSYWIHVRVDHPSEVVDDEIAGKLIDARLDIKGKHAADTNPGDFAHPDLYHVAVRVQAVR